jgi:hypothetical protein
MSTSTRARVRTILADVPARTLEAVPDGAGRALLAGVEAAVFAWLCVVIPAVATYVATAAAPALGDATWLQAAAAGSGVWRLAHGGALSVAGASVSIVPLGLSALAVGTAAFSLRRARVLTWPGVIAATLGYAGATLVLASLPPAATGGLGRTAAGAVLVGATGALLAVRRGRRSLPPLHWELEVQLRRIPREARSALVAGTRGAGMAVAGLLAVGAVLVLVSLGVHHERFSESLATLRAGALGVVMLVVACLLLLPTVLVWAVAWVAGPGFAVGVGTSVTPDGVIVGPLPVFPLTAALPGPSPLAGWTPLVVVAAGIGIGWYLHTRHLQDRLWGSAVSAAVAALGCGAATWLLAEASSGSVGPGRMAEVGPDPLLLAAQVTGQVGLGAIVLVLAARRDTVAFARRQGSRVWAATRGAPHRLRAPRG